MIASPSQFFAFARALMAGIALAGTLTLHAAPTGGFSATLSADQQVITGIASLTLEQRTTLDRLVAAELAQLRSGEAAELNGTFMSRRTEAEIAAAGLDQLSPEQLAKLNESTANALASRPQPRERPRLKDSDVISAKKGPEIHGTFSLAYGWGRGGRDMRASSLWVDITDPDSRVGIGIGISQFDGDGFFGYYPGDYGYGAYPFGRHSFIRDPFFFEPGYDTFPYYRNGSLFCDDGWSSRGGFSRSPWRR